MPSYSWTLSIPAAAPGTALPGYVFADEAASEAPDFGFDILTLPDLDVTFTPRRDVLVLADAFARRLFTPRLSLWAHPGYGFDIRDYLNDEVTLKTLAEIRSGAEAQAEQDERFYAAVVRVGYDGNREAIILRAQLRTEIGPFALTLAVDKLTADITVEE